MKGPEECLKLLFLIEILSIFTYRRLKEKKKKNVLKKVEKKRDKEGDFSDLRGEINFTYFYSEAL